MEKESLPPLESSLIKRLLHFLHVGRGPDTPEDLEQEIQELIEEGEEQGLITHQEGKMINSIFEFRDTLTHEIMIPHPEMVCLEVHSSFQDIVNLINQQGFTRIPVYVETPDHIVGIIHAKDLLAHCGKPLSPPLSELAKPAFFVSEKMRIVELLKEFQTKKLHMAIIIDEFGGVRGLITIEDLLEEIVGEITDESDDASDKGLKVIDDNTILVVAKIDIEEVEGHFDLKLPEGPYESIGGLIIHQLGRVPEPAENIEIDNLSFQVLSASKRKIDRVKIHRITSS